MIFITVNYEHIFGL